MVEAALEDCALVLLESRVFDSLDSGLEIGNLLPALQGPLSVFIQAGNDRVSSFSRLWVEFICRSPTFQSLLDLVEFLFDRTGMNCLIGV